ncbi:plastocyanin/azurin family copper-binding protein [uncultured Spirosoma sp.]|uniref:plastocyanin/azurin family copper-binding protein n=1 Tax=uncultured Spirosoma sp. TaxID=278208 RepID=UPI00258FA2F9|nr:plastocyanin/azurin family copper-binding protein [uncultured Spirosoma sp.]
MGKLLLLLSAVLLHVSAWAQRDTTITITTSGGLQFDQKRLVVRPNTRLHLIFQNKDDMAHNLVVTRPNARLRVVEFALALGDKGPALHHIPVMSDVLAHTVSVEPGNIDSLTVKVADGAYPFVCTYPGHGAVMYGVVYATNEPEKLPPPSEDRNLPNPDRVAEAGMQHHHANASGHPYPLTLPAIYRTFMPDCGPAAIAVGLPGSDGGQSYVFDAGSCRLRYAWSGGFVDNSEQWDGKGQRFTKVVGDIYYRDTDDFPWRVGNQTPVVQFKGYRLIDRYPEFRYLVNGVEVRELIRPRVGGRGLVRTFTIAPTKQPLTFRATAQPGIQYKTSAGRLQNNQIRLPAGTRQFSLTLSTL